MQDGRRFNKLEPLAGHRIIKHVKYGLETENLLSIFDTSAQEDLSREIWHCEQGWPISFLAALYPQLCAKSPITLGWTETGHPKTCKSVPRTADLQAHSRNGI